MVAGCEAESSEDGLVNLRRAPAADFSSTVEENLHQADHAGVLDRDARHTGPACGNGQRQALKQGEINVDIERFRLEGRKAVGDGGELLPNRLEILKRLLQPEVLEVVAQCFQAQEGCELLVHAQDGVAATGAENMMAVV